VNICLFKNFSFKIAFFTIKQNHDLHILLFHTVNLKFQSLLTVCYQWIYASSIEFWLLLMEPLWDSFLNVCNSWASVTTTMLLQQGENIKVTLCHNPTWPDRRKHCCSNLDGSYSNVSHTALPWDQVTVIFSALWGCIMVVKYSKMLQQCKKLQHSSVHKTQNSMLMADIQYQHIVTQACTLRWLFWKTLIVLFSQEQCHF